jgi:hypothetical protein
MGFAFKSLSGYLAKAFLRKLFYNNYLVSKPVRFKLLAGL